jgi:NADH dehydrogenase
MRRTAGRSHRPLVFGRGENLVTFSAVDDVTAAVGRALTDPACRNHVMEVGGPTMTFNQLAASLAGELGPATRNPRHVPRPLLRAMAAAGHGGPARKADAALAMDTHDFTWQDPGPTPPGSDGGSRSGDALPVP